MSSGSLCLSRAVVMREEYAEQSVAASLRATPPWWPHSPAHHLDAYGTVTVPIVALLAAALYTQPDLLTLSTTQLKVSPLTLVRELE